jgi:putative sulfotransferase
MSSDPTEILPDIAALIRPLSDSLLPGEDITLETKLGADLGLHSLALANLSGRLQARFGPAANVVPFLAGRDPGPISDIRVGELVDYVAGVLDQAGSPRSAAGGGRSEAEQMASDMMRTVLLDEEVPLTELEQPADWQPPRNENASVLAEIAPGAVRNVLQFPGGQVETFTAGAGPAVVLMHPINVGVGVFARQFARLADRYQVIALHNPGVGATTWEADLTLGGLARLQRTVLTELSVAPPFHVIGTSFGGLVAQEFAVQHRTECASLILVDCSYRAGARGGGPRPLTAIMQEEFDHMYDAGEPGPAPFAPRAALESLLRRSESMDPRVGLVYLDGFKYLPSMYARLPQIAAPTLVVRGDLDTMVPAEDAQVLLKGIPDARFEALPKAGHFPCLTHPAEVDALIAPFLAAQASGRRAVTAVVSEPGDTRPGETAGIEPAGPIRAPGRAIIIGTGRCGSTMLSDLLSHESQTLSMSESLSPIRGRMLVQPLNEFTGAQYWSMLSQPGAQHGHLLTRIGLTGRQYSYPDNGRYAIDKTRVPPILRIALPKVTPDPDRLFDQLAVKVPQFPTQPVGLHHRMLLDLVAELEGRVRWVERTGASSMVAYPWLSANLDAKVVYLTRNTADTALSMSKHPVFQLSAIRNQFHQRYGADPYVRVLERSLPDDLPDDMRRLLPENLTAQTLRNLDYDLGFYETTIEQMNGSAEQALADLQPRELLRVRYEDILADPVTELAGLGEFIGLRDPSGWATQVAAQVNPPRKSAAARA